MFTKKLSRQGEGFTLIELLVVISIISLLSSIIFVSLSAARAKARDAQRISELSSLKTALEWYRLDNGAYPNTESLWVCNVAIPDLGCAAAPEGQYIDLATKYIPKLPVDPISSVGRGYAFKSDGKGYKVLIFRGMESGPAAGFTDEKYTLSNFPSLSICTNTNDYVQNGGDPINAPCSQW